MIARSSSRTLLALISLSSAALAIVGCTTDFDRFNGNTSAGGGGNAQSSTTSSNGGGGATSSTGGNGGGGADPCAGKDCNDDKPCTDDSCEAGECKHVPAVAPDLSGEDIAGDCKDPVCNGDVVEQSMNDDTEVPAADSNDCTDDICSNGTPYPPTMAGTTCTGGFCDGAGTCQSCNGPADCGTPPECVDSFTCLAHVCLPEYTADQTAIGGDPTDGDCKRPVCDGAGAKVDGIDDTDILTDPDTTNCVHPTCNNGVAGVANENNGHVCNDGAGNDSDGRCRNGNCEDCQTGVGSPFGCDAGDVCDNGHDCCSPPTTAMACMAVACGNTTDSCDQTVACPDTCAANHPPDGSICKTSFCGCNGADDCSDTNTGPNCLGSGKCGCSSGANCTNHGKGPNCTNSKCACNNDNQCGDAQLGPDCVSNGCGCTGGGTACGTNKNGPDCLTALGRCGCDVTADCAASPAGPVCVGAPTGTCGCTVVGDCAASAQGHLCIAASSTCGCNATSDCAAGTCDTTNHVCI